MVTSGWLDGLRSWFSSGTRTRITSRKLIRRVQRSCFRKGFGEGLEDRLVLSAIVVTGTGDSLAVDGVVTLREAITSVNNGANFNADVTSVGVYGTNDTIRFNIAGTSTISPSLPLPTIVKPLTINGYSQPGTSPNTLVNGDDAVLRIELNGIGAGLNAGGLVLGVGSGGSSVSGLVINRFSGAGILVRSDGNTISGNFIGTGATGNVGASTTGTIGIAIDGSFRNVIGGLTPADRNVIGGNSDGINLNTGSQNNVIQGNFIGVGADGATSVGNRLHGIVLQGDGGLGVQNNEIGGIATGAGNTIANNGLAGVAVFGNPLATRQNTGNTVLGNSIFHNGLNSPTTLLGIDLVGTTSYPTDDDVTANDMGDGDNGPNLLPNFPVLISATSDLVSTTIVGSLDSNTNTTYRIEFFSNPTVSGTGFGEGQTFLGFTDVTTDNTGRVSFIATLASSVPNGQFVTATATSDGSSTGAVASGAESILGSAAAFAVLAGSTATITGPTVLVGDVGVSPGSVVAGAFVTTGEIHIADAVAAQAQVDLTTAFDSLASMMPFIDLTGQDLGGLTLIPGVYHFNTSAQLTGPIPLILDTQGDPHALFVFQIGSTLTTAAGVGSAVVVVGGPSDRIFWQVGSSATIGVGTAFVGNILAEASITLATGASLSSGRALARSGAVTLDTIVADSTTPSQNNTSEFSAPAQIQPSMPIPNVTLAIAPSSIAEAAGTSTVTATLSAISGQNVIVDLAYSGTATNVTDYIRSGAQIVILAGNISGTVTLTAVQDAQIETNESIIVDISTVTNGSELGTQRDTVTITDDDAGPSVRLAIVPTTIAEAAGTATITATLSTISSQPVIVALAYSGTASNSVDYARSATQILIPAGSLTGTATVTAVQDTLDEANETIIVDISGVTNGTEFGTQQDTVSITDDDAAPTVTLAIAPTTIAEAAGTTNITARLSAISAQNVIVDLAYNGTATNVSDYVRSGTQIVILAGSTTGTATITAVQDARDEANETIIVDIINVTNGTELGTQQDTVTITDDDATPTVTLAIAPTTISEAGGTTTVTATLSAVSGQNVIVDLAYSGTATNVSDYVRSSTQILIPAGSTTGTATITTVQDAMDEVNETVIVDIVGVTNAAESGIQQDTVTIVDDDSGPTVTLSIVPTTIAEAAGTTSITATLSSVSAQNVVVDLAYTGTATNVSDYVRSGMQIVILAGSTSGTATLTAVQDTLDETNETVVVDIASVTNGAEFGTQRDTITITDDDATPTVTLAIVPTTIAEAAGTTTITAKLSAVSGQNVIVDLAYTGTATNAADYVRSGTQIVILAGNTTGTATLTALQDTMDEANETVIVHIVGVTNGTESGTQQDTVTIIDDDAPPTVTLSIAPTAITEAAGTTTVKATLSNISNQNVIVDLAYTGTATNVVDYTRSGTQIVILAGSLTGAATLTAAQDTVVDPNETIVVDITGVTNATELGTQRDTVVITDDDSPPPPLPTLSINDISVAEGNVGTTNAVFTVTLSAVSAQPVTVVVSSSNGTANTPSDYVALPPTTLTFAPGETQKIVTVAVNGDSVSEANETFFINLATAVNATIADNQGVGRVLNDDGFSGAPGFVGLVNDPENPGQKVLVANGTIANDTIFIESRLYGQQILVKLNYVVVGIFDHGQISRIVSNGFGGNDLIHVDPLLGKPTELRGSEGNDTLYSGSGNDQLYGGDGNDYLFGRDGLDRLYGEAGDDQLFGESGHDILLGSTGNDSLFGGADRDILIAGIGNDYLFGEGGEDIMIGGTTSHDNNVTALAAILAEWTSGNSYETRVSNIRQGLGQSDGFTLNAGTLPAASTVQDDGFSDEVYSGGDRDWLFNFGTANDKLRDRYSAEVVN